MGRSVNRLGIASKEVLSVCKLMMTVKDDPAFLSSLNAFVDESRRWVSIVSIEATKGRGNRVVVRNVRLVECRPLVGDFKDVMEALSLIMEERPDTKKLMCREGLSMNEAIKFVLVEYGSRSRMLAKHLTRALEECVSAQ